MKRILCLGALILSLTAGNTHALLYIDYDNTGRQYPDQILDFYAGLPGAPVHSNGFMWLDYGGYVDPTYGPHSTNAMAFSLNNDPVSIDWGTDVENVNFWYGYANVQPFYVRGYNDSEVVFDSGVLPLNSNGMAQYVAPDVKIDRLVFNGRPNYWTYDDLSYDVAQQSGGGNGGGPTVPEPLTLITMGTGLAAFALRKKLS